jgi:hypothetical protein
LSYPSSLRARGQDNHWAGTQEMSLMLAFRPTARLLNQLSRSAGGRRWISRR